MEVVDETEALQRFFEGRRALSPGTLRRVGEKGEASVGFLLRYSLIWENSGAWGRGRGASSNACRVEHGRCVAGKRGLLGFARRRLREGELEGQRRALKGHQDRSPRIAHGPCQKGNPDHNANAASRGALNDSLSLPGTPPSPSRLLKLHASVLYLLSSAPRSSPCVTV